MLEQTARVGVKDACATSQQDTNLPPLFVSMSTRLKSEKDPKNEKCDSKEINNFSKFYRDLKSVCRNRHQGVE